MAHGMKRYMDRKSSGTFKIQITSMVDMFVILLVFLLKNYSTSPVQVNPSKDLRLPDSTASKPPSEDALKLVVTSQGIFVEEKKVVEFENGNFKKVDINNTDPMFIKALFDELDAQAEKSKEISKLNETVQFEGKIFMQADRELPYELLQKVMYTSSMAGFADLKLAVMIPN